jgi:hypothetical protein
MVMVVVDRDDDSFQFRHWIHALFVVIPIDPTENLRNTGAVIRRVRYTLWSLVQLYGIGPF